METISSSFLVWKSEVSIFDVVIKSVVFSLSVYVCLTVAFSLRGMSCGISLGQRDQQTPMLRIIKTKYCTQQSEKCWEVACISW